MLSGINKQHVVDRILRKQQAERKAAEDAAMEKARETVLISHTEPHSAQRSEPTNGVSQAGAPLPQQPIGVRSSLEQWKRKITGKNDPLPPLPGGFPSPSPPERPTSQSRPPTNGITPWSNIGMY